MLPRHAVTDSEWARVQGLLPARGPAADNRLFLDAALWVDRGGVAGPAGPVRPLELGLAAVRPVVPARGVGAGVRGPAGPGHRVAADGRDRRPRPPVRGPGENKAGGTGGQGEQALGRSRGGFGTAAHVRVSGPGLPTTFALTPGQAADITQADALPDGAAPEVVIADKGYDERALVERIEAMGAEAVIPTRKDRNEQREIDRERYKDRNLVERFWSKAKHCRRVATRYDKTARNFQAFLHIASVMILLR